ncbi:MAG: nucleotide exchange factor GrpE [bacterium]
MAKLLDEVAEDNTAMVGVINRVLETQEALRSDIFREFEGLRNEFAGALTYRVLKDLCKELISPLTAMEAMLQEADFSDTQTIRSHVESLVITLNSVLSRMGAEKISISPGEEVFDPNRHRCVRVLTPEESPFPSAPPRTVVQVVEDGYTLAGRILSPAKVEVQAENDYKELEFREDKEGKNNKNASDKEVDNEC